MRWAYDEIQRAGLFDEDSDYGGMIGTELMAMVRTFSGAGHSGVSAAYVTHIFGLLVARKALTPITTDPDEWMDVSEMSGREMWQSRRQSSLFSQDGGRTYYDIDEQPSRARRFASWLLRHRFLKYHAAALQLKEEA